MKPVKRERYEREEDWKLLKCGSLAKSWKLTDKVDQICNPEILDGIGEGSTLLKYLEKRRS